MCGTLKLGHISEYQQLVVKMHIYTFTHIYYLTIHRTIESLYEELAREGIIVKCPKTRLSEFVGDYR